MFFLKNHGKIEAEKLVPETFLFFIKSLYEVKASGEHLRFDVTEVIDLDTIKTKWSFANLRNGTSELKLKLELILQTPLSSLPYVLWTPNLARW